MTEIPARIRLVRTFDELRTTPLAGGINALCWPRRLPGDFAAVAARFAGQPGVTAIDEEALASLRSSAADDEKAAMDVLLGDLRLLRDEGLDPELDAVRGYARDERHGPVRTDVCSFHVDRAPVETDTWLCTYHGAPSEGLANEDAERLVDVAEVRATLLASYGGGDGDGFREHLAGHSYDLHYRAKPFARPFSFGVGNLWRIATLWPGCPVPPCIHRAPAMSPQDGPRLLLIS